MPDIAMCQNETCPKREECYRYKATPCHYQSYSNFEWEHRDHEHGKEVFCRDFLLLRKKTEE